MKKTTSVQKTIHNSKKIIKGILCFCEHIPEKKPDEPTEILVWKVSIREMGNESLNTFSCQSID